MTDRDYDDYPDEWGVVKCQNCGTTNDLPDGRWTTECWNCDKTIAADNGKVIPDGEVAIDRYGNTKPQ